MTKLFVEIPTSYTQVLTLRKNWLPIFYIFQPGLICIVHREMQQLFGDFEFDATFDK